MSSENTQQKVIREAILDLEKNTKSVSNPRAKAIVKTKLQEAYLWAGEMDSERFC